MAWERFGDIVMLVGSPLMTGLMESVRRVAASSANVLIEGETGTGKELIARAIHYYSPRTAAPWVDINCAALPDHLAESELFGYEKGAFSGADAPKPGLFEMAQDGTLFLDEIGELDWKLQSKLLRILDGTPYFRLGGTRKVAVRARIVAATNRKLESAVMGGEFRRDLYHRLGAIRIETPPLRSRRAEIRPLAEYFLQKERPGACFAPQVLHVLETYDWPGNIRELRNVVASAGALCADGVIGLPHLPGCLRNSDASDSEALLRLAAAVHTPEDESSFRLETMERQMVERAMSFTRGHQQRAANLLGLSRRTLSRKLKEWGKPHRSGG
jgi:transcriptional regulator with PAS, ATPase and Fis domain